ncbi:LysE family translocator [Pseudogemmobacter sonorensis]|uniref:LysE family translocator n=1 Tax=Pseudogemmobacter sonorensis TaxID=2989681 RepID=UPI0036820E24
MTGFELAMAILALLVTPGPTNTLMFLAGAERGALRAMRLIPAELCGYLATVLPLTLFGAAVLADRPGLRAGVALAAGIWVAWLALRLWRLPDPARVQASVDGRTVFVTTLLNPKALIFGLVLLPAPEGVWINLAHFSAQVVAVACLWALGGALIAARRAGGGSPPWVRRAAAVWLGGLSVLLVLRGIGAA